MLFLRNFGGLINVPLFDFGNGFALAGHRKFGDPLATDDK